MLNVFLSPLIAFTIYFCFLHSVRHSLSLIYEIDSNDFKVGFYKFIRKALPLTLMTLLLFIISLYFLAKYYVFDDAILKVIFIGLASLTFPHILLSILLKKMKNKDLKIYLAAPRGFCAGVDRAIEIVKKSINKFGSPVYVRHEIVHNKHVVENLKKLVQYL